jgi:hypothetical protein
VVNKTLTNALESKSVRFLTGSNKLSRYKLLMKIQKTIENNSLRKLSRNRVGQKL